MDIKKTFKNYLNIIKSNKKRVAFIVLVVSFIVFINVSLSQQVKYEEIIVSNTDVVLGERLDLDNLTKKKVEVETKPVGSISYNLKNEIGNTIYGNNLKKGDIVLSHFVYKNEGQLAIDNLDENESLFYVKASDFHIIPQSIYANQYISIYSFDKETNTSKELLKGIKITAIKRDEGVIGLSLSGDEIIILTTSIAKKENLQIVVKN